MTFQVRETLIFRGQKRKIRALPLTGCERPLPKLGGYSSACWRGYEGTWEVRDDVLHLVELAAEGGLGSPEGLGLMFPESNGPVEAAWFSGEIVLDDVVDPDTTGGRSHRQSSRLLEFVWLTLVIHRGNLLLEEVIDLQKGVRQGRLTRHVDGLFSAPEMAILRAIQANAEDMTPKLVYADWLEERGDPRADLLRTEVERLKKEGPRRRWAERRFRQDIPRGYVSPEDMTWFWRYLAAVPDLTPEEREYRQMLEQLGLGRVHS